MINFKYVYKILPEMALAFGLTALAFFGVAMETLLQPGTPLPTLDTWEAWALPPAVGAVYAGYDAAVAVLSKRGRFVLHDADGDGIADDDTVSP